MMARLPDVLHEYGSALKHGHNFLFHALPRLLTLWLDHSAVLPDLSALVDERAKAAEDSRNSNRGKPNIPLSESHKAAAQQQKEAASYLDKALTVMRELVDALPAYIWLCSFSQIVSRICHKNTKTADLLAQIIANVLAAHPQQGLWGIASILPSSPNENAARNSSTSKTDRPERVARARQILQQAKSINPHSNLPSAAKIYAVLVQSLLAVCNYNASKSQKTFSMPTEMPAETARIATALRTLPVLVPCKID
jgi:serine/threonine-protein kinase ATR